MKKRFGKIQVDSDSREGSAFYEALLALPWQTPKEEFNDHKYENIEVGLARDGQPLERLALLKKDPTYLWRGHGFPNPDISRRDFLHATPLPDFAISQYCIFNGGGPLSLESPTKEYFGIDFHTMAFLTQYRAKDEQLFYRDEELEEKIDHRQTITGRMLADISHFNDVDHFETRIDATYRPMYQYAVIGCKIGFLADERANSIGQLHFPARVAKIMTSEGYTDEGGIFLRQYQMIMNEVGIKPPILRVGSQPA